MKTELRFIYSNEPRWRLVRHGSFWLCWFLFQLLLYSFSPSQPLQQQGFFQRLMITWPDTLLYILPSLFLSYTLMYWVIPRLILPGRYFIASIIIIGLVLLTGVFSALLSVTVIDYIRHYFASAFSPVVARQPHPPFYIQLGVAMLAGFRGSITVGGIAASIKLMKCVYEKQEAALTIEKEKVQAELQTLKAQLHPHFLFNTLNNIYSFTQSNPEKASVMIMRLSQLLRYILYECDTALVPLDKEIKMLGDYIALEKVRYDAKLDISLTLPAPGTKGYIAPLILLPFLENAFKHGASRMIESPWISLSIQVQEDRLIMKLVNGKPVGASGQQAGIGISNVRMRLELLYPHRHELSIQEEEEMYIVNLTIATGNLHFNSINP